MKCIKLATVLAVAVVLILAQGPVGAQGANFQWENVTVNEALAALNRQYQLNYSISGELGQRKFSASLTNATPEQAFQTILKEANLTAANDAGVWRIQEKPERAAAGRGMWGQMPGLPQPMYGGGWGQPGFGGRQPPMPFRQVPPQVQRGVGPGWPTGITAEDSEKWDPENWVMRIIPLKYIDPYLVTDIFGGSTVGGEQYGGGGRGGYGGYGGGGGRGGYGGSGYDRGYGGGRYDQGYGGGRYDQGYGGGRYDQGYGGRGRYDQGYGGSRYDQGYGGSQRGYGGGYGYGY